LIEAFSSELEMLDAEGEYTSLLKESQEILETIQEEDDSFTEDQQETADYIVEELFDALDTFSPPFCYFGAHEGDASDYGFWPSDDAIENEVCEGNLIKLESGEEVPSEYTGEYVAFVSDHGNLAIYRRGTRWDYVWGIV
jgi:hypothetical protein